MKLAAVLLVLASAVYGGRIDVTHSQTFELNTGGSLLFHIGVWNYGRQAARSGDPWPYPGAVDFALHSLPVSEPDLAFEVALEPVHGGSCSASLGGLTPVEGYVWSSAYTGPTAALMGRFSLEAECAANLFRPAGLAPWSDGAVLRFTNHGAPFTVGYPGTELKHALFVSLRGDSFSVGAVPGSVEAISNPEPSTVSMLLLAVAAWGGWRYFSWRRKAGAAAARPGAV